MSFSSRAGQAVIPSGGTTRWFSVVEGEGDCAEPRIVLVGTDGPLRIRLGWTAGKGDQQVELTVGRGIKVCVWARTVRVWAQQIGGNANIKVSVTVADGWEPTRNAIHADVPIGNTTFQIPEWAQSVRLELGNEAEMVNSSLALVDPAGITRSRVLGNAQPDRGLALAGIASVDVASTAVGRLLFDLVF